MTPKQIDALQPGPELDKAVADAAGYPACIRDGQCWRGYNFSTGPGVAGAETSFSPSVDWNDAMWAAGKVQLFCGKRREPDPTKTGYEAIGYNFPYLVQRGDFYAVMQWEWWSGTPFDLAGSIPEHSHHACVSTGPSGPAAICRAILYCTME